MLRQRETTDCHVKLFHMHACCPILRKIMPLHTISSTQPLRFVPTARFRAMFSSTIICVGTGLTPHCAHVISAPSYDACASATPSLNLKAALCYGIQMCWLSLIVQVAVWMLSLASHDNAFLETVKLLELQRHSKNRKVPLGSDAVLPTGPADSARPSQPNQQVPAVLDMGDVFSAHERSTLLDRYNCSGTRLGCCRRLRGQLANLNCTCPLVDHDIEVCLWEPSYSQFVGS